MNHEKKGKHTNTELDLRQRAETLLKGHSIDTEDLSNEDIQELLHEIQVHQVELSKQNEQLRETQQRLEMSNSRYKDIFDFAPNGYFIIDRKGIILQVNLTGCQLLGLQRSELIGKPFSRYVTKESQDIYYLARQKALLTTKTNVYELNIKRHDNTAFNAQLESIAIKDSDGEYSQLRTSITDITEVIQARMILDHEQLLKQLIVAAAEAIILIDDHGIIRMVNKRCEHLFGYTETELLGKPMEILLPKSFKSIHEGYRNNYIKNPYLRPMGADRDFFGITKSGDRISIEIGLSTFMVNEKRMVTAFVNDITERKKAEEELRNEKETVQLYLDMASSIFIVIDKDGKVVLINRKGCEVLGFPEDQIKGKIWFDHFLPKTQANDVKAVFKEVMRERELESLFYENEIVAKGGRLKAIEWHNAVLTNSNGDRIGTISSGVDVTERNKAQAALFNAVYVGQEQERVRISRELHDSIGQQLAASKMLLGAFEHEVEKLDSESKNYYKKAVELLEMATVETRTISHNLAPYYLAEKGLVPTLEKLCIEFNGNNKIHCSLQTSGMNVIRLDNQIEIALYRISQELYSNIIKHALATEVKVYLKRFKNNVILIVEDNGVGIKGNFEQIQSKGIGLKNISTRVKGLLGRLTIDSSNRPGTRVSVEIPLDGSK
jgi:PAS domain S-box-containing protein